MEESSSPIPQPVDIRDLGSNHRFYKPRNDGNLQAQLDRYSYTEGSRTADIADKCKLAFALNELFAAELSMGKLYIIRETFMSASNSDYPMPDLLFVAGYQWDEHSRNALFTLPPSNRAYFQTAGLARHDPCEPVLPIRIFARPCAPLAIRTDPTLKISGPQAPQPEKGLWIRTAPGTPVLAGIAEQVARCGIVHRPEGAPWVVRRLDEACAEHRRYLELSVVGGSGEGDPCVALKTWLVSMAIGLGPDYCVRWGEIVTREEMVLGGVRLPLRELGGFLSEDEMDVDAEGEEE